MMAVCTTFIIFVCIFGQYRANSRHHDKSYNVTRNPTDLLISMCVCVVTTKFWERIQK
ncbi:hypothetical protein NC651_028777 [Populus alba x Populus x berolinensis]|nr:hypothetical protein NC651_028777 [Populus alba x Populus x berolinensis]